MNFAVADLFLVPLRRAVEMNFNGLPFFRQIVPMTVGLPAFCDNLDQDSPQLWHGNVRGSILIGFDVQLRDLVFFDFALFYVLYVDTGVHHRNIFFATSDNKRKPVDRSILLRCLRLGLRWFAILRGCLNCLATEQNKGDATWNQSRKFHSDLHSILYGTQYF